MNELVPIWQLGLAGSIVWVGKNKLFLEEGSSCFGP